LFEFLKRKQSVQKPAQRTISKRFFQAAGYGRLDDYNATFSLNADINSGLATIRSRARAIVNDSGHAKNIVTTLKNNIVGDNGVVFSCQAKRPNGSLDASDNNLVNVEFAKWCKYGNCTVDGAMDFVKAQELVLETVAVDGECLILFRRGREFGKHQFQFEILAPDNLDEYYFTMMSNGNIVYQGVELNKYNRAVAYHIWRYNRNDPAQQLQAQSNERIRVPAEDMLHIFDPNVPKQVRGISWFVASLVPIHHLSKLSVNELEMTRLAAMEQVAFKIKEGEGYQTPDDDDLTDTADYINQTADSGSITILPPGVEPVALDWKSPNLHMPQFRKDKLREIAAGFSTSYNSISKDLESVNYSSARFGALEDHISWSSKQKWFINVFCNRVYVEWMSTQLVIGTFPFVGLSKLDKFLDVKWQPRGWQSVDPVKDANANASNLENLLTTRTEIAAQTGGTFEELVNKQVEEYLYIKKTFEAAGLPVPPPSYMALTIKHAPQEPAQVKP